jgi:hypothetical protein
MEASGLPHSLSALPSWVEPPVPIGEESGCVRKPPGRCGAEKHILTFAGTRTRAVQPAARLSYTGSQYGHTK